MSKEPDILTQALTVAGNQHAFRRVAKVNFYREGSETVSVLNLQRSSWGPQFYLNAGVWLTRLGPDRRPKEHKCHIRWRVNAVMPDDDARELAIALDLESSMEDCARSASIEQAADRFGFGLLARCDSEQGALKVADTLKPNVAISLAAVT